MRPGGPTSDEWTVSSVAFVAFVGAPAMTANLRPAYRAAIGVDSGCALWGTPDGGLAVRV